jgi:hypothetical protein
LTISQLKIWQLSGNAKPFFCTALVEQITAPALYVWKGPNLPPECTDIREEMSANNRKILAPNHSTKFPPLIQNLNTERIHRRHRWKTHWWNRFNWVNRSTVSGAEVSWASLTRRSALLNEQQYKVTVLSDGHDLRQERYYRRPTTYRLRHYSIMYKYFLNIKYL